MEEQHVSISQSTLKEWERQREELAEKLEACQQELDESRREHHKQLQVFQFRTAQENMNLRHRIAQREEEKSWWAGKYVNFETSIKSLQAELETAKQETDGLNEELGVKSQTIVDLNEKLLQADAEVRKLKEIIRTLQSFQSSLTDQETIHLKCRKTLESAEKEHECKKNEIVTKLRKEMEKKHELHEAQMATAQQLAEEKQMKMQISIDGLFGENKRLHKHIAKIEAELKEKSKSYLQKVRELDLSKARLAEAQEEAEKNKLRVEHVRSRCVMANMATGALMAEKDATIQEKENEMERLLYTLHVRDMELEDARDGKSAPTAKPQEVTAAPQKKPQEKAAAPQEEPQEEELEKEFRISEQRLRELLNAEASITSYYQIERTFKGEMNYMRSIVKAQGAKIRHLREYLERFKSDVHHCISVIGNKKVFGQRYEKLRARYIECTDCELLPEYVCAPVLKKLEQKVEKYRRWMQCFQASLTDCLTVTWNHFEFKDKVVALNNFVKIEDPLDPWDDEPRAMQNLQQIQTALKKEILRFKREFQNSSKKQGELISQVNAGRLENVRLKEDLWATKKQLGQAKMETVEVKAELQATKRQLEKAAKPAHKKVHSWLNKNVLQRPRLNPVGVEPPATPLTDECDQRGTNEDGSPESPGDSPGVSSTDTRDSRLRTLFSVSTP
ncbi:uncharacterized protein V6R79_010504 [Siganus canaliculatus]